ncbi:UDP-N-acetylmuramate--L-alanine ligase [Clostridia bacterium OttesenSCG-928-F22]|nr:UDP-N-acetylmuramate--L-alanine ligase [Clostridia bacterium OttesenSCG-928-F22]
MNNIRIEDYKGERIHFIGVGGCSMNGLARILYSLGYTVSGSDKTESNFTRSVREKGIPVTIGHAPSSIDGAGLIVYSAAIKADNPEMQRARELHIPCIERATLLGLMSSHYEDVIGIAGCHGKTTITSMLALILQKANMDATVHVGGETDFLDAGVCIGNGPTFLTEACEYMESFLTLSPKQALIHNVDDDHLDYFSGIEQIYATYEKFLKLLPEDGTFYACTDDELVQKLAKNSPHTIVRYGLNEKEGYSARNIAYDAYGNSSFDFMQNGKLICTIKLSVPGEHNVQNALAAATVAHHIGVLADDIVNALGEYHLAKRRFEYYGETDGVRIFHDYAHHPNEIKACLQAASNVPHNKLWVIFQCNSYSRAKTLLAKYSTAFSQADEVLVPDIYPGREVDTGIIHARDLANGLKKSCPNTHYIPTFEEIAQHVKARWKDGDMLIGLGSGDVYIQLRKLMD